MLASNFTFALKKTRASSRNVGKVSFRVSWYSENFPLVWNMFDDGACIIGFDLYSSQHQKDIRLHVHWGGGGEVSCQGQ